MTRRRQPIKWEFGLTRIFFSSVATEKICTSATAVARARQCKSSLASRNLSAALVKLGLSGRGGRFRIVCLGFGLMRLAIAWPAPRLEALGEFLAMRAPPRIVEL